MTTLQRAGTKHNLLVATRTCITPKCTNPTQSFYCDECWDRQQAAAQTA